MPSRGKLIVLGILLLAVALAVGNMIFQTRASGRAVAHWGSEAARLILTASQAEVLRLEPASDGSTSADHLDVAGQRLVIAQRVDISQARGALHFRRALVADSLYVWDATPGAPSAERDWRFAIQFHEGNAAFTLLLPEGCEVVSGLGDPRSLEVRPGENGTSPLREFVSEQFAR